LDYHYGNRPGFCDRVQCKREGDHADLDLYRGGNVPCRGRLRGNAGGS
jgi:hypothetical protein